VLLGQAADAEQALETARRYETPASAEAALSEVIAYWDRTLTTITIKTPDEAMNLLVNRWLLYQTQACRVWARSAFYQSGGAFGFRDQLQDRLVNDLRATLAMLYSPIL
jgi:cellobiose phosphorylase